MRVSCQADLELNVNQNGEYEMSWNLGVVLRNAGLGCLALVTLFLLLPFEAFSQTAPLEVFGGFSDFGVGDCCQHVSFWGLQGGVSKGVYRNLGAVADFGGQYKKIGSTAFQEYQYMAGPQFSIRRESVTGFAHALVGGTHFHCGASQACPSQTGLAAGAGGGLDFNLSSSMSIRMPQVDWVATQFDRQWRKNNIRLGFGVVYKLR